MSRGATANDLLRQVMADKSPEQAAAEQAFGAKAEAAERLLGGVNGLLLRLDAGAANLDQHALALQQARQGVDEVTGSLDMIGVNSTSLNLMRSARRSAQEAVLAIAALRLDRNDAQLQADTSEVREALGRASSSIPGAEEGLQPARRAIFDASQELAKLAIGEGDSDTVRRVFEHVEAADRVIRDWEGAAAGRAVPKLRDTMTLVQRDLTDIVVARPVTADTSEARAHLERARSDVRSAAERVQRGSLLDDVESLFSMLLREPDAVRGEAAAAAAGGAAGAAATPAPSAAPARAEPSGVEVANDIMRKLGIAPVAGDLIEKVGGVPTVAPPSIVTSVVEAGSAVAGQVASKLR